MEERTAEREGNAGGVQLGRGVRAGKEEKCASTHFDNVYGDLDGRNGSSVLKPVFGRSVLRPANSRPIFRSHPVSMVGDRALKDIDRSRSIDMIVKRAEDTARFNGDQAHPQLAALHPLDFGPQVNRSKGLNGYPSGLRNDRLIAQGGLLSDV